MTEAASAVSALAAGQRVRLKSDPARVGVLTGQTVERRGLVRREVSFPDGTEFVGIGVMPDIEVSQTLEDFREGRDPVLDRAVEELEARLR